MLVLLNLVLRPSFLQLLYVNSLLDPGCQDLTLPVKSSFGFADLIQGFCCLYCSFEEGKGLGNMKAVLGRVSSGKKEAM